MSNIAFKLAAPQTKTRALYASTEAVPDNAEQSSLFYFVFLSEGVTAPATIDNLAQCFAKESLVLLGAFVFVEGSPPAPDALFAELEGNIKPGTNPVTYPRLTWRAEANSYQTIELSAGMAVPPPGKQLPFGRWIVDVGVGSTIVQGQGDQQGDQVVIQKAVGSEGNSLTVVVIEDGNPEEQGSYPDLIDIPLSGLHTGGMQFEWQWEHRKLQDQFGGELRMFYSSDSASVATVRYPMFMPPGRPSTRPVNNLQFNVTAHPLAPLNGSRTRLALSPAPPENFNNLEPLLMRTPTGSDVTLKALATGTTTDGAGFGFAKTAADSGGHDLYMTPVGHFTVERVDKPSVQIMAGTSGSEFVLTGVGDVLAFENQHPAFAKGFDPNSNRQTPLADDYTTSWVKVHVAQPGNGDAVVGTSYCAQPSGATYFARHAEQSVEHFPSAVGISLSQFAKVDPAKNPVFPFLPYGGVFYSDQYNPNPNPSVEATTVGKIETHVVEPRRRDQIQPCFNPIYGPIFFDAANNTPFDGGNARTPMGFIAKLNTVAAEPPAGSWNALELAQSPQDATQFLRLNPNSNGVVNPAFSNSVLRDNLFMVVTDPSLLWPNASPQWPDKKPEPLFSIDSTFISELNASQLSAPLRAEFQSNKRSLTSNAAVTDKSDNIWWVITDGTTRYRIENQNQKLEVFILGNEIQLGDFTFQVNIGPYVKYSEGVKDSDRDYPQALAVFKFMPNISFVDMVKNIEDTNRWTKFFAKDDTDQGVFDRIQGYLEKASTGDQQLYAAFNSIVNDPNWTGVIFFNCPLDYKELPSDIQILLGGIDGTLRAHHFGVTINRVTDEVTGAMSIENSSLFAVIDYAKELVVPPAAYPGFQVLLFNVEYANSKLVIFNSRIAFSIDELFGDTAELTIAPDPTGDPPVGDNKQYGSIVIDGVYTLHEDGTGSLLFATDAKRVFTFPADDETLRVLVAQSIDNATLVPVSSTPQSDQTVIAVAAFRLDCTLAFQPDIAGDLFSYGETKEDDLDQGMPEKGLVIIDYAFGMTTIIPATVGPAKLEPIVQDLSGLKVDQALSESRQDSFENTFPSKIDSLLYVDDKKAQSMLEATGAWPLLNDDLGLAKLALNYLLRFKVPMGSLGGLVSRTNNIISDLYVGWIPAGTGEKSSSTANKYGAILVLPPIAAGPDGFNIQGIITSKFEAVHLDRLEFEDKTKTVELYDLRFTHYSAYLLGVPLFYQSAGEIIGPRDMGIFGDPNNPGGDNAMWVVGQAEDSSWKDGPTISLDFWEKLPEVFIGRAYKIETDPTDPKVIDDAIEELNIFGSKTVEEIIKMISAQYDSAAGMTFALKFEFKALTFSVLLHDNDFYGAKIALDFSEEDEDEKEGEGDEKEGEGEKAEGNGDDKEKKKGLDKLQGFEFSIIYRKISEHLGVWSATIFIDVGEIEIGAGSLTLPDFSISIWTNGDWRFSVGWPLDDHPIVVQFQAGPIPVIAKLGFYLAKLSSEASPSSLLIPSDPPTDPLQYPPNFKLIWSFGLGISAGVGKEWEKGPFSASASLTLGLTVQGFLASYQGNMSKDGIDYYWWCISLALVGEVEGKVDFKIISASLSITLTLTIALAIETRHKTHLVLTFEAEVKASVKIVFVTIHFSFSTTLTILDTNMGSGTAVASLDGPTPKDVLTSQRITQESQPKSMAAMMSDRTPDLVPRTRQRMPPMAMAAESFEVELAPREKLQSFAAEAATQVYVNFLLQSTATSTDGQAWIPQGIASLVVENIDATSQFSTMANGIGNWLLTNFKDFKDYPGYTGNTTFAQQLDNVEAALQKGLFDGKVDDCLRQFSFNISGFTSEPEDPPRVAVMPVHPSLGWEYNGKSQQFGTPLVSDNYAELVQSYFEPGNQAAPQAMATGTQSVASLLFGEYFQMLAKQLVADVQKEVQTAGADNLKDALTTDVLGNIGGFVTRFLLGGIRLPKPDATSTLAPLYVLTNQQFKLDPEKKVLSAKLIASGTLPGYITLNGDVAATLKTTQFYDTAPASRDTWKVSCTPPISPVPAKFPMNVSLAWTDQKGTTQSIYNFADSLHLAIEKWQEANADKPGPWLRLEQVTGTTPPTKGKPYPHGSGALILPLSLKTIPKPDGAAGEVLKDIYSLVGTDEVHRAYLQELLDDPNVNVSSLELACSTGQGEYASTESPVQVLVRTNLSTSTAPSGSSAAAAAVNSAKAGAPDPYCSNYAKPGEAKAGSDGEWKKFLRLVWECSIVHTGGFYLQVEGLKPEQFKNGVASLQLVVQTGPAAETIQAEAYHNALIGPVPDPQSAVFADLCSDLAGTPVVTYTATYPGGSTGWSVVWSSPPDSFDATGGAASALQGLYQMVSYRPTAIDGTAIDTNWSRPVTGLVTTEGTTTIWTYQKSFPTAPLLGQNENTYVAIGKTVDVALSIEDIYGNSLPPTSKTLVVKYNDDLLGLANWVGTQTNFKVSKSSKTKNPWLEVNFSYGSLLFSLGDFTDIAGLAKKLVAQADPVSKFVWGTLTPDAQKILADAKSTPEQVQVALIQGLNTLIRSGKIYEATTFNDVTLSAQTQALLTKDPSGNLLIFLNRMLLQDAYPDLIQPQVADAKNTVQVGQALKDYIRISNQLRDPKVSAEIDTGALLALPGTLTADVLTSLQGFVDAIVCWLTWQSNPSGNAPYIPAPMTLSFDLDKSYPANQPVNPQNKWTGDLRELRIDLLLQRKGVDVDTATKAPQVQSVSSPITPVQGKSTAQDPTGLSAFAMNFETAYFEFDGQPDGVIKVATGVNSNLKSSRLGTQSLWLARWGKTAGITVDIINTDTDKPVYYAPPPLSTQLITRTVKDLFDYGTNPPTPIAEQVFSSVDIDRVAANFLSSVENIFSPELAPPVAKLSGAASEDTKVYDSYVTSKTDLAKSIADKLAYIYQDVAADKSDPPSAIETMRQALLHTLENDYGIAALVQMAAQIGLHGDVERGGMSPPNLYGNISTLNILPEEGGTTVNPLPYNFSAAKLPLKEGKAWLNFLFSVQDPAAQKAMKFELDYQMSAIEHDIDPDATRCNYTPSNWLAFVLQQNPPDLPQKQENTLTAPMGTARIPIPLRSYPPLPKLLLASAKQDTPPTTKNSTISDFLSWTYNLTVARPSAAQDTLNLMVTFNEPAEAAKGEETPPGFRAVSGRPGDLFDQLARYSFEYPQLEPAIQALAAGDGAAESQQTLTSEQAVKYFRDIASDVSAAWHGWEPPTPAVQTLLKSAQADQDHEVWTYSIYWETDGSLNCTSSWSRELGSPPWPEIEGFNYPPQENTVKNGDETTTVWVYTLKDPSKNPPNWKMSWSKLFVLDYQSARASAFTERNRNLGGSTGEKTNDAFVYRTETVRMPSPNVPLIKAQETINLLPTQETLQDSVSLMLDAMHTKPSVSFGSDGAANALKLEGPISYAFRLLENTDSVQSFLPLFLMQKEAADEDDATAYQVASNMNDWQSGTKPKIDNSTVSFRLTIFATKIVQGAEQLPLVQFQDLSVSVPPDKPKWWDPTK